MTASDSARDGEATEYTRWNFAVIVIESTFFMAGLAWVDPAAVLPLFVGRLTPSTVVIGAIAVVQQVGWKLPQVFMAAVLGHRPHKLPFLRWPVLFGRLPFFAFVVYLWLVGVNDPAVVIWFLVIGYSCISLGNGFLGISWNDIIAKSIPSRLRGRFFGTMQFTTAVAAFGVGFVVRWVLGPGGPGFPMDYTWLFTAVAVSLALSTIGCWLVREPIRPALDRPQSFGAILRGIMPMLRGQPAFRALVVTALFGFGIAFAMSFYVVFAKKELGVAEATAGIYIWAMTIGGAVASILWGYLNDSRGPRAVLRGAGLMVMMTPLLAVLIPAAVQAVPALRSALPYLFAIVFLSGGASIGAMWMGSTNCLFELADHADRPRYLGVFHLCTLPGALGALLIGWLLNWLSFTTVFLLMSAGGAAALVAALLMPDVSRGLRSAS
jgi:MFS family permease